jgi:hypothetical protein
MILPKTKKPKIFVTTGSSLEFDLLTTEIDKININKEFEIIVQTGKGKYLPKNCNFFDFDKSFDKYYDWADLVEITLATIFINNQKPKKLLEIMNNHELEEITSNDPLIEDLKTNVLAKIKTPPINGKISRVNLTLYMRFGSPQQKLKKGK